MTFTRTKNADHEKIKVDKIMKTIPGELVELSARESRFGGQQERGIVSHVGRIRYDDNFFGTGKTLQPEMMMIHEGRRFNIIGQLETKRGRGAVLELEELNQ